MFVNINGNLIKFNCILQNMKLIFFTFRANIKKMLPTQGFKNSLLTSVFTKNNKKKFIHLFVFGQHHCIPVNQRCPNYRRFTVHWLNIVLIIVSE